MPQWPTGIQWPTPTGQWPVPDPIQATTSTSVIEWWRPDRGLAADRSTWDGYRGNVAAQGTAGSRPAFEATGFSSRESILFDGVDDTLVVTSGPLLAALSGNDVPFTAYTVFEFVTLSALGTVFAAANNTTTAIYHWQYGTATTWTSQRQSNDVASNPSGGTTVAATKYFMRHYFTGTTTTLRVNQTTVITAGAQNNAAATFNRYSFGSVQISAPAGFSNIRIADHWIVAGQANAYEDALYAAYVADRYQLVS
jgi:hypothetical protein